MHWILILILFIVDIYTKIIAEKKLKYQPRSYFGGKLQFYYVRNFGIAFNKLNHKKNFILMCNFVLLFYIGYLLLVSPMNKTGLALVLAGGLGNTLNRLIRGYVIDFLYFSVKGFPVFNLADFYIFGGMGIILVQDLF